MNLKSVVFSIFHCLYFKLLRILLWSIFLTKHRWTLLPGDLGVLGCAIDVLCDLGHPLHLLESQRMVNS